jgi:hypothetical protein
MNIVIVRAFVKLREVLASHRRLAVRIGKLDATQKLKQPLPGRRARIGFYPGQK